MITVEPIEGTNVRRVRRDGRMIGTVMGTRLAINLPLGKQEVDEIRDQIKGIHSVIVAPDVPEHLIRPRRAIDDIDDFDA